MLGKLVVFDGIPMPSRISNALIANDITTIKDLMSLSKKEFIRFANIGSMCSDVLSDILNENGFYWPAKQRCPNCGSLLSDRLVNIIHDLPAECDLGDLWIA